MLHGRIARLLIGRGLRTLRPGMDALALHDRGFAAAPATIRVASPAFPNAGRMPARFTDDGEGLSPPLEWTGVPDAARGLALIVEDADAPGARPLVHAIAPSLPPRDGGLAEGELPNRRRSAGAERMGRNSFAGRNWLPPSPPPEHGIHRYAFQLFALDHAPDFPHPPGRSLLLAALRGHVIARGMLVGTYERD